MPRRAKAVALDATPAPVPANNEWHRGLTKHRGREPMVRIRLPPPERVCKLSLSRALPQCVGPNFKLI